MNFSSTALGSERPPIWLTPTECSIDKNGPARPISPPPDAFVQRSIFATFREVALHYSSRIAVDDGSLRLTYRELFKAASQLASAVAGASRPGQAIGILVPHSSWFMVAALACLAAGRPYIALDLRYPRQRNEDIIQEAGPAAIIMHGAHCANVSLHPGIQQIDLAQIDFEGRPTGEGKYASVSIDDPAIILYTSGSTGKPKGIVNSQRAVLQRAFQHILSCHIDQDDIFLPLSSFCTIAGTREAFTAVLTGAKLYLVDPERAGLREVRRAMREQGATIVYAVPALIRAVIEADSGTDDFKTLRVVRVGGDRVLWSDIDLLRRAMPASCFLQIGYSSTETTGAQWFVPAHHPEKGACVAVGHLLPGIEFTIVNEEGLAVPTGHVGELVIRSPYVALGQWRDGRCVPEGVILDLMDHGKRILATGDLVCLHETGLLEVVGRKDRQIKINGTRVEPAELELMLRRSAGVADAAVIVRKSDGQTALVAFVVPALNSGETLAKELRRSIRSVLAPALRPARLHTIEAMPRLPSAKLDTLALQRVDDALLGDAAGPAAAALSAKAAPHILRAVENTWRNVLGRRALAPDLGWDEAGGDSLTLLQFVFALEEELGASLPLEHFRMNMTAAAFAEAIEDAMAAPGGQPSATIGTDARPTIFIFPGLTGDSPGLASFRVELEDAVRFIPIAYPDWREMTDRSTTIEDMADAAVAQVLAEVPEGEIKLTGYSLGGAVAYVAATRLARMGRQVGYFAVLDTNICGERRLEGRFISGLRKMGRTSLRLIRRIDSGQQRVCQALAQWLTDPRHRRLLRGLSRQGLGWLPVTTRFTLQAELSEALQRRALSQWISAGPPAQRLPGQAILLRSEEPRIAPRDLGWSRCFERVAVIDVSGDHRTMLRLPHRPAVCARFAETVTGS